MPTTDRDPENVRKGATIRELRRAYGLTQEQLAVAIHVTPRWLGYIEAGDRKADVPFCRRVADVLGVPLAAITVENYADIVDAAAAAAGENDEANLP